MNGLAAKSRTIRVASIVSCLLALCAGIAAQRLPFKNYTTAVGLAHDRVNKIVRDSRGFLWFCTGEGLSRFDGYEFKNYTQADGLPHRNINDILELENGIYLVATSDGLTIFDQNGRRPATSNSEPDTDLRFRTIRPSDQGSSNRPFTVNTLYQTRDRQVYLTTTDSLLSVSYDGREWSFKRHDAQAWTGKMLEFGPIAEDGQGFLWLGTQNSVWRYSPVTGNAQMISAGAGSISITVDSLKRIWVGGGANELALSLYEYSESDSEPKLTRSFTTKDGLTDNQWMNSIFETSDGRILAGVRNGLCEYQPSDDPKQPAFSQLFLTDVVSVSEDTGGNIWLGSATHGAFKLTRRGFVSYELPEKMPYGGLTSIFAGSGDEIFVTSSDTDLIRFDGEKFSEIKPYGMGPRSWGWNQLDLRSRFTGEWWVPTSVGLYRYPAVTNFSDLERIEPKKIYKTGSGLRSNDIFSLFEDSQGYLWFSNVSAAGELIRFDPRTEAVFQVSSMHETPSRSAAIAYGEDAAGGIWMGYYSGGLARYRDGKIRYFAVNEGFPSGLVNAIYRDIKGRLWIATSNSGIVRIDEPASEELRYQKISVAEGLSSNQASCIAEDRIGRIYVGTAKGINRIDPDTGRIKIYTEADGLPGNSIGRCTADSKGNLWFSQKFTMIRYTPIMEEPAAAPAIFVGGIRVNGQRTGQFSELGENTIGGLSFDSDARQVQIDYFALSFATGERLQYQYKLNDSDWSSPSALRTINLNLQPGDHRFVVRAVNSEGIVSESPASVSFSIAGPVWQRWWFLVIAALIAALLIYMVYRYRISQLLRLERIRTRIAADLHDDIGSGLSQIAILSEVARQRIGDSRAKESLDAIAETSREAVDSMSDIVWAINPAKDGLGDLVHRMRRFAGDVLEAKDIGYRFQATENEQISLGADVRREVYLIFKECINNIAKHSGASEANLSVGLNANTLVITAEDNGVGFVPPSFDQHVTHDGFGGNGLINIEKRVRGLGGTLLIDSKPGSGCTVVVSIPVRSSGLAGKIGSYFGDNS